MLFILLIIVLCQSLMYSIVTQSYIYTHTHILLFILSSIMVSTYLLNTYYMLGTVVP